jgi:hypothetical protein
MDSPTLQRVLCTCPKCCKNVFFEDRNTCHGIYVHPRTQQKHCSASCNNEGKALAIFLVKLALDESPTLLDKPKSTKTTCQTQVANCNSSDDSEYRPPVMTNCVYPFFSSFDFIIKLILFFLLVYIMYFITWLYLFFGISQDKCQEAVEYILYLVKHCCSLPPDVEIKTKIPEDVRNYN